MGDFARRNWEELTHNFGLSRIGQKFEKKGDRPSNVFKKKQKEAYDSYKMQDELKKFAETYAQTGRSLDRDILYRAWLEYNGTHLYDYDLDALEYYTQKEIEAMNRSGSGRTRNRTSGSTANERGEVAPAFGEAHDPEDEYKAVKNRLNSLHSW